MNRRGFFGRIGTLIAGLFAAKAVAPPQFKSKMWYTPARQSSASPTTIHFKWDDYGAIGDHIVTADGDPICDECGRYWYSNAK